jgi:hypothetical protein
MHSRTPTQSAAQREQSLPVGILQLVEFVAGFLLCLPPRLELVKRRRLGQSHPVALTHRFIHMSVYRVGGVLEKEPLGTQC